MLLDSGSSPEWRYELLDSVTLESLDDRVHGELLEKSSVEDDEAALDSSRLSLLRMTDEEQLDSVTLESLDDWVHEELLDDSIG